MTRVLIIAIVVAACVGITYLALARGDRKERP